MAGRIPRILRLHTLPGQLIFLSTVSLASGWGITQLRDTSSDSSSSSAGKASAGKGRTMQRGDIVDVIQGQGQNRNASATSGVGDTRGGITLADALTAERSASLWWNYARDSPAITGRLVSRDKESTLLVPVDKSILALGRKPHQHPGFSYKGAFSSSKTNTERFLQAHIIDGTVKASGKAQTLLDGFSVDLIVDKSVKGGWKIQPGDIEVLGEKETSNGKILYIGKVLPY
ncbi:uncharacterized protein I303_101938 [Kwoniella dejecticola CBS 10117]|uniref:FAS1 domain-containing protein n=1 Tax=Kwoniella dejecticola CBS 10117 TaxID=1296121 RepID=A0A1A6ACD8_9TREE|nr:uncharacterized protein I303_01926 [Kwoniella dejecticola CBS 10117]OBR87715.1 hypothetical protein I303_01926 [Kwoniella dejecticola CBS 10117]